MACSPQNIDHKAIEIALDQYMDSIKQKIKTFKRRKVPATTVGQYALNNRVAVDADTATDVSPGTTDRFADVATDVLSGKSIKDSFQDNAEIALDNTRYDLINGLNTFKQKRNPKKTPDTKKRRKTPDTKKHRKHGNFYTSKDVKASIQLCIIML